MKLIKQRWWGFYNDSFTKWYQYYGDKLMWTIG